MEPAVLMLICREGLRLRLMSSDYDIMHFLRSLMVLWFDVNWKGLWVLKRLWVLHLYLPWLEW